jgi:hypothetical protein
MSQGEAEPLGHHLAHHHSLTSTVPVGAHIIRAVRAYDSYVHDFKWGHVEGDTRAEAITELRVDVEADHSGQVLDALERVVAREPRRSVEHQLSVVH